MGNLNEVVIKEEKPKLNGNGTGEKPVVNEDDKKKEEINS